MGKRWVWLAGLVVLVACGSPEQGGEPDTSWIESELRTLYAGTPGDMRYFSGSADLNGDGNPEVVVYVVGPMLCGSGGCDTVVLTPGSDGYELVGTIRVTRPPIRVGPGTSHGWRDLVVRVSGGGLIPGHDATLHFDGTTYPSNPTVAPADPEADVEDARTLIPEFNEFTDGTLVSRTELGDPPTGQGSQEVGVFSQSGPEGSWVWVSFQGMDDSFLEVDDPVRYALEIRSDGVSVLADCNRGTGGVRIDGSSIRFTEIATTQMACPPGSLDQKYLSYLEYVRGWVRESGDLYLSLMADGGIMRFQNGSRDAVVSGTQYHATGEVPCAMGGDQPLGSCPFEVLREGDGNGTVTVTRPDGGTRSIFFQDGRAIGHDRSEADPGEFQATREGDSSIVMIGQEWYEIPDAVIYGG